ncbi:basic helix-loop-helix transcription factor [Lithospermum erythrorhizon]|uniref:Basic helix-loop-helix transcription factor n=1 Tax=Lithospermum erythrorhizon TaxID=34254 RepID=A0AAV3RIN0_LITER
MLSLSNSSFPSFVLPLHDIFLSNNNNDNNNNGSYNDNELLRFRECLESSSHSPQFHQPKQNSEPLSSPGASTDHTSGSKMVMKKKESHNANERDRRMKISALYSTLRTLLPPSDQTKKLSIPGTVSQVVNYIPELQEEVKKMIHKKEELLSFESKKQKDQILMSAHEKMLEPRGSMMMASSLMSVSASSLANNKEVLVQFSTIKFNQSLMSKVLEKLEEDGLCVLNATTYESGDKLFHSLHLEVQGTLQCELDVIPQRLVHHCSIKN